MIREEAIKPRILISLYSFYPYEDANTNAIMPLINNIQEHYYIDIFSCNKNNSESLYSEYGGLVVYRYPHEIGYRAKLTYWHYAVVNKRNGWKSLFAGSIKKRIARFIIFFFPSEEEKRLKRLINNNGYNAVISVTSPITTQRALLQLSKKGFLKKKKVKWFPLFQDPYSFYFGFKDISDYLLKFEQQVYLHADMVFVTPELIKSYKNNALSSYYSKMRSLNFANMRQYDNIYDHDPLSMGDRIQCLYVGSFQDIRIRNPKYLFEVVRETSDDIFFHFIISTWDKECSDLKDIYLEGVSNVMFYDRVSLDEAQFFIRSADILINVGNNAGNQTPSKVVDYISAGKPIVNFYEISDDTSKILLERYPYALNLKQGTYSAKQAALKLQSFCRCNLNRRVDYQSLRSLYPEYDSNSIVEKFIHDIDSYLNIN